MKTIDLNNDTIRYYIPNTFAEVEGETPLYAKLRPFLASAKLWLESDYLGSDDFLSEAHNELAMKVLVAKAFADAVPSLDLMLTPSGFGVIRTDSMTPASKERVGRLTDSLGGYVRANLALLVDICRTYPQWRTSERGRYFCSTFFPSLTDFYRCEGNGFGSYDEMRSHCLRVEKALAEKYLGSQLMTQLRSDYAAGTLTPEHPVVSLIRAAVMRFRPDAGGIDQNALWHAAAPVIGELRSFPALHDVWEAEMADVFSAPGFVNNIKGGFYF